MKAKVSFGNLMARLLKQRGFTLQKVSPTTFPPDVITTHRRQKDNYTEAELAGILNLLNTRGLVFRCRIGRSRYYYADSVSGAIEAALAAVKPVAGELPK